MPSWSDERVPEPECPLIMPCAAKKSLIFSRNMVTLLFSFGREREREQRVRSRLYGDTTCKGGCTSTRGAYLEPLGALLPKAKALKAETDAGLASTLCVWSFITFLNEREYEDDEEDDDDERGYGVDMDINLATDSASIAARLGAYRAFCLGRSGLLSLWLLWWSRRDGSPRGGGRVVHCSGRE